MVDSFHSHMQILVERDLILNLTNKQMLLANTEKY